MATITSAGLGSGLDVSTIVSKLTELERTPITQLQREASTIQSKISSFGSLTSTVSSLKDAASKLNQASTWSATTATSADASAVAVSTDSNAAAGNYSVAVQSLAMGQTTASATYASSGATIGIGTLTFDIGTYGAGLSTFTTNPNWPRATVEITAADDSLEKVRDKINSAGVGVVASVVTDATGSRLVFRSAATGAANAFKVSATDGDGNDTDASGLSALAYDPTRSITNMASMQPAANAKLTINNLPVESATNTVTGAVEGLTLKLNKVTTSAVDVGVTQDTESIKKAITAFTTAYTNLNTLIKEQTKYDATTKKAGTLQGDSAAISIQSRMRAILSQTSGASSVYGQLSQVGISIDANGALSVSGSKLDAALSANLGEVKKLFSNLDSTNTANNGFAQRFTDLASEVTSFEGTLSTRTSGLQKRLSDNTKRQAELEDRVALFQARLTKQYNSLDTTMSNLNGLSTYVSQQIAAMNKSNT